MKRTLFLFLVLSLFSSCSILQKAAKRPEISISDSQLEALISESVNEVLRLDWLSDYLTTNNQRPIVMTSILTHPEYVLLNADLAYATFDMELTKSGQVRVVKSDETQRTMLPSDLAKGKSVDYVLSSIVKENTETKPSTYSFVVKLWADSINPVLEINKSIETIFSE